MNFLLTTQKNTTSSGDFFQLAGERQTEEDALTKGHPTGQKHPGGHRRLGAIEGAVPSYLPFPLGAPETRPSPKQPLRWPVKLLSLAAEKFLLRWLQTRLALTPGLRAEHVEQNPTPCPSPQTSAKQMVPEFFRIESSAQCHCIHLPTSEAIQGPFQGSHQ